MYGIQATVVNARFVKPMDTEVLKSFVPKTSFVMTVEENVLMGGFGSAVLEQLSILGATPKKTVLHGLPDIFIPHGSPSTLRKKYKLDKEGILAVISEKMGLKEKGVRHLHPVSGVAPASPSVKERKAS